MLAIAGAAGGVLAAATTRVVDWFVMTDELLYERLAFSAARSGSPIPTLRGAHIPVGNDLYPLLLALVAKHDEVPAFLHRAHLLNAFLIASAAIPVFLLARDALRSRLAAYAAAALSVLVPWLVLASFLLTENAAYPAFLWGVYLVQRTVRRPSAAADLLALGGILVATAARTQFAVLLLTAPAAMLLCDAAPRTTLRRHRTFAAALALLALAVGVLAAIGDGSTVLGFYSSTTQGSLRLDAVPRAFVQHLATVALALGILPFLLGAAWLGTRSLRRDPFAVVASLAATLLALEVASFDLRFGGDIPRDRYLFYIAPLVLVAFVGALREPRAPRLSLAAPLVLLVLGFESAPLPVFSKLNVDTPAAILDDYLLRAGHGVGGARTLLVACTALLLAIFLLGRAIAGRRLVAVVLIAATAAATTAESVYAFDRLFRVDGTSGRPVTLPQGIVFDWVDRTLGTDKDVTIVPYAQIPGDYWATAGWWWDMEFWNRSVTRGAYIHNEYAEIQTTFPKLPLTFDPATGRASISPTRYVAESGRDSRFRMRGRQVSLTRDVLLIDAGARWRADWLTLGIDDDGFTFPGRTGTIRVYPYDGQTEPRVRYLALYVNAVSARVGAAFRSNAGSWSVELPPGSDTTEQVSVCVPARGFADVTVVPHGSGRVWGDLSTRSGIGLQRVRGIWLNRIALADEIGPRCSP
ncbi:MAG TPA: hypothetical protein VFA82_04640 [Gaiellaceae bacterium]|nr:hypothetical protein [Gaiellaceae bacterium]